jgi:hypothetical protein
MSRYLSKEEIESCFGKPIPKEIREVIRITAKQIEKELERAAQKQSKQLKRFRTKQGS